MPHRATLYNVRVYPRNKRKPPLRPLGDFDESGTALKDVINGIFRAGVFSNINDDKTRSVTCVKSAVDGDEVHSMFFAGQSGMVAEIVNANNKPQYRQSTTDSQLVRCASVFRLEPNETMGWWAVHVNNGRSAKGLVQQKLLELFKDAHEDLTMKIAPVVRGADLAEAVKRGRIDKVTLVRLERPSDRARAADTGKWVDAGDDAKLELEIKGKTHWLSNTLLSRYLKGDHSVFGEIVEFEGLKFDHAKVQVELSNGDRRTFNIEEPEAGHAFSVDLDDDLKFAGGEPTEKSLYAALGDAIDVLT